MYCCVNSFKVCFRVLEKRKGEGLDILKGKKKKGNREYSHTLQGCSLLIKKIKTPKNLQFGLSSKIY